MKIPFLTVRRFAGATTRRWNMVFRCDGSPGQYVFSVRRCGQENECDPKNSISKDERFIL